MTWQDTVFAVWNRSLLLVYSYQPRSSNRIITYMGGTWHVLSGESSILIGLSVCEVCSYICPDVPLKWPHHLPLCHFVFLNLFFIAFVTSLFLYSVNVDTAFCYGNLFGLCFLYHWLTCTKIYLVILDAGRLILKWRRSLELCTHSAASKRTNMANCLILSHPRNSEWRIEENL